MPAAQPDRIELEKAMKRVPMIAAGVSLMLCVLGASRLVYAEGDILINDFEAPDYGPWRVEGEAFGQRPAQANVRPRNRVTGHLGEGLVNTFLGGDLPTGKLTSPPFAIERNHINFLIGAGGHEGKTCMNLIVDGRIVRSTAGPALKNLDGQEVMDWADWDVAELKGKQATLQIVDDHSGGWGHINIDQIVQTDMPQKPSYPNFARLTDPQLRNVSLVPKFTFSETLQQQESELAGNPLLERFAESRKRLLQDPHYPRYHFSSPEHRLNDPNGLCFWQGRWHLFYQGYPPEDPRQHWGHAVSDDLIHWRDLPYAIYPNPERACFSGSAMVEEDRVIAMYHGTTVGSMVAVSDDPLLLNWEKVTGQAVIPHSKPGEPALPYNIFDPCIWKQGDYYYALTAGTLPEGPGGKRVRAEFLHRSQDLATWEYLHPFLENDRYGLVGDDGACPYFWPIGTGADQKHILLHFSHMSGGKFLLGDYDTERQKFVVTDGGDFNHGPVTPSGVHAPSACPDGEGGVIAIFNMNPGKPTDGWNQLMSLPMRLTLEGPSPGLAFEPAGDVASLRGLHRHLEKIELEANRELVLDGIAGNSMEIAAEIATRGAQMVELNVLRSPGAEEITRICFFPGRGYRSHGQGRIRPGVISIDCSRSSTLPDVGSRPPETADVFVDQGEPLKLRVFLDRSVVEVFVNGRQYAAVRVYPGREDSVGVSLRAQGSDAELTSLDAWQMESIYE
jgi:beta-fructofuranosidase